MMWGDEHQSDTGMCEPCGCNRSNRSSNNNRKNNRSNRSNRKNNNRNRSNQCCQRIYDKAFLKELDALATEYPVDFYTESRPTLLGGTNRNVLFRRFLKETVLPCHNKTLRATPNYATHCPTKNIRWHYADVRFMPNTVESILFQPIVSEFSWHRMDRSFKEWEATGAVFSTSLSTLTRLLHVHHAAIEKRDAALSHAPSFRTDIRALRRGMIEALLQPVELDNPHALRRKYKTLFDVYLSYVTTENNATKGRRSILLKQLLKATDSSSSGLEPLDLSTFMADTFAAVMRQSMYSKDALLAMERTIRTQISPAVHDYLLLFFESDNATLSRHALYDTITYPSAKVRAKKKQEQPESPVLLALQAEQGDQAPRTVWYAFSTVVQYLFYLEAFFMDTYLLMRMMKPPQGSSSPYLSLVYVGGAHAERMAIMLRVAPYFHYELIYATVTPLGNPSEKRCISIRHPIRLAPDLEERARAILAHSPHRATLAKYKAILQSQAQAQQQQQQQEQDKKQQAQAQQPQQLQPQQAPPSISYIPSPPSASFPTPTASFPAPSSSGLSLRPSFSFPTPSAPSSSGLSLTPSYSFPSSSSPYSPYSPYPPSSPSLLSLLPSSVHTGRRNGTRKNKNNNKNNNNKYS